MAILLLNLTVIYSVIGDCPSYNISSHKRYVCVELDRACIPGMHVIREMLRRHVESRQGFDTKVSPIVSRTLVSQVRGRNRKDGTMERRDSVVRT